MIYGVKTMLKASLDKERSDRNDVGTGDRVRSTEIAGISVRSMQRTRVYRKKHEESRVKVQST